MTDHVTRMSVAVTTRTGVNILVRHLARSDKEPFIALARQSLEFHRGWVSSPADSAAFDQFIARFDDQTSFCFVICSPGWNSIVGYITLVGVEYEPYLRGRLGYAVFEPYARKGFASAGLTAVISFLFEKLGLHRLEADIQPANTASTRLIRNMGFALEGVSPGLIRINGRWADHERWALTCDQWPARGGTEPDDQRPPIGTGDQLRRDR